MVAAVAVASILLFVSTFTFHDQAAIRFGASLNATTIAQSQAVRVYFDDWNSLDFKNSLPLSAGGLRTLNLSSGPCGGPYPGGIAVYEGAYDLSNVSGAAPLAFYEPGTYFGCPAAYITNSLTFNPHQNLTSYVDLVGYWTIAGSNGVLHPFLPGFYTVIAGDPLGNTRVMYFRVSTPTGTLFRSGPISTFPVSWLSPCNQSASGNVTTGTYLGLNSSSALDHINLDQVYQQILNSSTFPYRSVGHGWVVAEWYEIGGSGSDAGGGQVVGYFILTSDGVPSGYIHAFYDPLSGTTTMTFAQVPVASCSA